MASTTRAWDPATGDAELITAVRHGDLSAFGVLYERHADAARNVAARYVRPAEADDVVAGAFEKVLAVLQGGKGPDVAFRAYLFTVVRRRAVEAAGGARRVEATDDDRVFESSVGPLASTEDPVLRHFEDRTVAQAFMNLPERWQAVLWYTDIEGMTPATVAPMLGMTANGVAALAYRAREGLRQAYLQSHLGATAIDDACRAPSAHLGSYVRGGLSRRETAKVEAHLEECPRCQAAALELGDLARGMRAVVGPLVLGIAGAGAFGLMPHGVLLSGEALELADAPTADGAIDATGTTDAPSPSPAPGSGEEADASDAGGAAEAADVADVGLGAGAQAAAEVAAGPGAGAGGSGLLARAAARAATQGHSALVGAVAAAAAVALAVAGVGVATDWFGRGDDGGAPVVAVRDAVPVTEAAGTLASPGPLTDGVADDGPATPEAPAPQVPGPTTPRGPKASATSGSSSTSGASSTTGTSSTPGPSTRTGTTGTPSTEAPSTEAPSTEAPSTENPSTENPTTGAPTEPGDAGGAPSSEPAGTPSGPTSPEGPTEAAPSALVLEATGLVALGETELRLTVTNTAAAVARGTHLQVTFPAWATVRHAALLSDDAAQAAGTTGTSARYAPGTRGAGVRLLRADAAPDCAVTGSAARCTIADLVPGGSSAMTLSVLVDAHGVGSLDALAHVTTSLGEESRTLGIAVDPAPADPRAHVDATSPLVRGGDGLLSVAVTNVGEVAGPAVVQVTAPAGTTWRTGPYGALAAAGDADGWTCTAAAPDADALCRTGALPGKPRGSGGWQRLDLPVTTARDAAEPGAATVAVGTDEDALGPGRPTSLDAMLDVAVAVPSRDVVLQARADRASASAVLPFAVGSAGRALTGATVRVEVPAGLEVVDVSPPGDGACDVTAAAGATHVVCPGVDLPTGRSFTAALTVRAVAGQHMGWLRPRVSVTAAPSSGVPLTLESREASVRVDDEHFGLRWSGTGALDVVEVGAPLLYCDESTVACVAAMSTPVNNDALRQVPLADLGGAYSVSSSATLGPLDGATVRYAALYWGG